MIRRLALVGCVMLLLGGGIAYQVWYEPTRFKVDIGAGMLAKQLCSCVFVAKRDLEDCRADQFESMDPIQVELQRESGRVRAFLLGFGERVAVHREGLGCTLQ